MELKAIVPFKRRGAKSRLKRLLTLEEREELALMMLNDVLTALSKSMIDEIEILATSGGFAVEEIEIGAMEVKYDERGLNEALNTAISGQEQPILIIMADIPLVTPDSINEMINRNEDVIVSPGRRGGTNALLLRKPSLFSVSYYGLSCIEHLERAALCNMSCGVHDSFFMSVDIDEIEDLVELLIHGKNTYSARYLNDLGLHLHADKESKRRVEVVR